MSRRMLGLFAAAATGAVLAGGVTATPAQAYDERVRPASEWGFDGWRTGKDFWGKPIAAVEPLDPGQVTTFVVHYEGGKRPWDKGTAWGGPGIPKAMHETAKRAHLEGATLDGGGPGIEYNFVITQAGEIWEGRGWGQRAGAVEGHNAESINVQIHVRGDQAPTEEALQATQWLYQKANARFARNLLIKGHQDMPGNATKCPGPHVGRWVDAGLIDDKVPPPPPPPEPPVPPGPPPFPGEDAFRIGQENPAVVILDEALIRKGYVHHHSGDGYQAGPLFTESTRANVADFQRDQGWTGAGADGFPGPETWRRLMS